ncbi:MAG: esterase-like activity of phytase family protein [Thermoanaerobaculia bacterium]
MLAASAGQAQPTSLELLGMAEIAGDPIVDGTPAGGLSGIAWEQGSGEYLAISDDRSERAPARFYRLAIELVDGRLAADGARILRAVTLRDRHGATFPERSLDPEELAISDDGFYISSEGDAKRSIPPFVSLFDDSGRMIRDLPIPRRYLPDGRTTGVRDNLAFEGLAITPDRRFLFAATENALTQEGPASAPGVSSLSRVLRWDLVHGGAPQEFLYRVEGINVSPPEPSDFLVNGLVSLLAFDDERLLALERQWVPGVGLSVRLYAVSLRGLDDVTAIDPPATFVLPVAEKTLLLDFAELGTRLDNFEGMTFGPPLADGRRTLFVISDDNFNPDLQRTLILGFAAGFEPVTIAGIQGAVQRSPLEGRWVAGVEGVVTAVDVRSRSRGFWIESERPDDDPATSEGLFVEWEGADTLTPGQRVTVGGRVVESGSGKNLPMTTLRLASLAVREQLGTLPPPPRLGRDRQVPHRVDDDGATQFEPADDALDFWESLEGMRLEIPPGTVVGPTRSFGEISLLPDGAPAVARTARGGVLLVPDDEQLARVLVGRRLSGVMPDLAVGDRVEEAFTGIVDYGFSNYKVQTLAPLVTSPPAACSGRTSLTDRRGRLTLATLNLENLSIANGADRMPAFGTVLTDELGAPAIVALEEVQDDSGPANDGVVTSERTIAGLVAAIRAAGGPRYEATWIDPENNRDGGQPSGNIRVAVLFDPARVELVRRGEAGAHLATEVEGSGRSTRLTRSPGRVAPDTKAFDPAAGEGVRKSLAAEFRVGRRSLFVIANHLSSKWDDDRSFGARQPPLRSTAEKRAAQARELRHFADSILAADPRARIVFLGDFNEPPWDEGISWLSRPPMVNLAGRIPPGELYTFNFEGISQAIDHVVVSPSLAAEAEIELVHRNSDCPDTVRVSDHDPVVVRLKLR